MKHGVSKYHDALPEKHISFHYQFCPGPILPERFQPSWRARRTPLHVLGIHTGGPAEEFEKEFDRVSETVEWYYGLVAGFLLLFLYVFWWLVVSDLMSNAPASSGITVKTPVRRRTGESQ